jgi:hypothetical protein
MYSWQRSTRDCTDCDGTAVAKTDQWGRVTHYACEDCGCRMEAE